MPHRNWTSWLFAAVPAFLGIFAIVLAFLPYGALKPFLDSFRPDGNFSILKSWNADVFKGIIGAGGLVLLGVVTLTGLQRRRLFTPFFTQLRTDAGVFFAGLHPRKNEISFLVAVLVIMVQAIIYRLKYSTYPIHHDEAYTYYAFANSLSASITDYHLPNNHVFHSILVYLSTRIFGVGPVAVRLPAFIAGVLWSRKYIGWPNVCMTAGPGLGRLCWWYFPGC
jgi:hypothetical protein